MSEVYASIITVTFVDISSLAVAFSSVCQTVIDDLFFAAVARRFFCPLPTRTQSNNLLQILWYL